MADKSHTMNPRPTWMPDFVPDDATLMISASDDDDVELQWTDDGQWTYKLVGAVLNAFRKENPDIRQRLNDAMY